MSTVHKESRGESADWIIDNETFTQSDAKLWESSPSDPTPEQYMKVVEDSGVLDFWNDADEDVYDPSDGEPI